MVSQAYAPAIPYGYRPVTGQLQKGDGLWNGTRFARVKKGYPFVGPQELIAIRRCVVEQGKLPEVNQAALEQGAAANEAEVPTMELE